MKHYRYLTDILFHPVEGFEELLWKKAGSLRVSAAILILLVTASVFKRQLTAYELNTNRPETFNLLHIIAGTIGIFLLWAVANWSVCTLMEGKGTFRNIVITVSYSLVPYIAFTFLVTLLSHIVASDEGIFLVWLSTIGMIWSGILLISSVMVVHQYSFYMTIWSIALTLLGMLLMVFLGILAYSLMQQVYLFFRTIANELFYRIQ